nr:MAG TPA: cysteine-rich protein [Caudoviricetes sp.]
MREHPLFVGSYVSNRSLFFLAAKDRDSDDSSFCKR